MFCTTLRRRSSFASVVPSLISPTGLTIKESQLETHDIAIPLSELPKTAHGSNSTRTLRLLLLSPNSMSASKLPATLSRIQHFAALTGGLDVAIIMSLSASKSFSSAKALLTTPENGAEGLNSYAILQSELMAQTDIPWIPILPLTRLDGLVELIKAHSQSINRPKPKPSSALRPLDMLAHCSVDLPLPSLAVNLASDIFPSLGHLAQAALMYQSSSISSAHGVQDLSSSDGTSTNDGNLKVAFNILAEQLKFDVVEGMADFWRDDWVVE